MNEGNKVKNVLQKYLQWPLLLSVLIICANVAIGMVSAKAGAIMSLFTILYLVCAGWLFWSSKKKVQAGLVSYAADYGWSQKQLLASMEIAGQEDMPADAGRKSRQKNTSAVI